MGFLFEKKRNEIRAGDALYGPRDRKARAATAEYIDDHGNLVVDIHWLIHGGLSAVETLPATMFTGTKNF